MLAGRQLKIDKENAMGMGSNVAIEEDEDNYRENAANVIAETAAKLVASGDCSREEAVERSGEYWRLQNEADGDPTGTIAADCHLPTPKNETSKAQVAAIKAELLEACRKYVN